MKRALVIVPNLLIIGFILIFVIRYANFKVEESNRIVIEEYEKMTATVNQIITNYLEDEQHLCDIWSNYVNRSAEAGTPMTAEDIVSYIRKAKTSPTSPVTRPSPPCAAATAEATSPLPATRKSVP